MSANRTNIIHYFAHLEASAMLCVWSQQLHVKAGATGMCNWQGVARRGIGVRRSLNGTHKLSASCPLRFALQPSNIGLHRQLSRAAPELSADQHIWWHRKP